MKTKAELLPECPVATTVSLIGSKWKLLIMRNLLVRPWRFNELRKSLDGISQKVLTDSDFSLVIPCGTAVQNLRTRCGYRQMALDWDAPAGGEEAAEQNRRKNNSRDFLDRSHDGYAPLSVIYLD